MRIISRYVTIEFLKIFLLISAGLTTVYMVVDLFENLSDFTKNHADFITIIKYFFLRLPQSIYYIVPLSLLFASFLNLGLFIKYNEVTAMRSGGLSSLHITSSMLIGTLIISILIFFLNDVIVPVANKRADDIKRKIEKGRKRHFLKRIASGLNPETIHYIMSDLSTLIRKYCGKSLSTPSILTFVSGRVSLRIRR